MAACAKLDPPINSQNWISCARVDHAFEIRYVTLRLLKRKCPHVSGHVFMQTTMLSKKPPQPHSWNETTAKFPAMCTGEATLSFAAQDFLLSQL